MFNELKYRFMMHNEKKHYTKLLNEQEQSDKVQKIEPEVKAFYHSNL